MPRSSKTATIDKSKSQRDDLIRYHCEEASTHLAALKQLIGNSYADTEHTDTREFLLRAGRNLNRIHTRHGGTPH